MGQIGSMGDRWFPGSWPALRQLRGTDRLGRGKAAQSERSAELRARTVRADRVVGSICPYCAVGCGQRVYVKDEQVIQIEEIRTARCREDGCAPRAARASNW